MDQDRPHEAPRNEVMETLDDWRNAWNRYGTPITTVLAVILISYAAWNFFHANKQNAHNEAWSALAASTSPATFRGVAEDTGDAAVRQNAAARRGGPAARRGRAGAALGRGRLRRR